MPNYKTIPEATMAKTPTYNTVSKAVQATRDTYDGFLKNLPAGQAGRLELAEGDNAKSIMMSLRQASKRTSIALVKVVHASDPERVEFTVAKSAPVEAARQPVGATA